MSFSFLKDTHLERIIQEYLAHEVDAVLMAGYDPTDWQKQRLSKRNFNRLGWELALVASLVCRSSHDLENDPKYLPDRKDAACCYWRNSLDFYQQKIRTHRKTNRPIKQTD